MPLVDKPSDIDWLAQQEQSLASFAEKVGHCIEHSDWEQLTLTLASRQAFLERLLGGSIPEDCRNAIKQRIDDESCKNRRRRSEEHIGSEPDRLVTALAQRVRRAGKAHRCLIDGHHAYLALSASAACIRPRM